MEDTLSILVATDNHLGYMEKDPVRGKDSISTFEEILQIAKARRVDFILLGGDLFHDNKPSRSTMYSTMALLREYCWGSRPCPVQVLSDPSTMLAGQRVTTINYLDPNINVSIPIFTIHGNHDDPTGDGRCSAVDVLAISGLVNYFGKVGNVDDITISPVLLQKGSTRLAIYGMGNVRDERLNRTFRRRNVKIMRPEAEDDEDNEGANSWFNMMVIHQNRAAHGRKNYIPENFLDNFLHFVLWGHEHECLIDPVMNPVQEFHVCQPGSSIATSLSEGESKQKHVGILQIRGKSFKMEKIRLKTVRPFQMAETILSRDLPQDTGAGSEKAVMRHLRTLVQSLLDTACSEYQALNPGVSEADIPRPLIRVKASVFLRPLTCKKVEYSGGFTTFNPQQFGREFVGKVANPKDILLFYRKKGASGGTRTNGDMSLDDDQAVGASNGIGALNGEDAGMRMEDLVQEYLEAEQLSILPENQLTEAVGIFVEKDDREAIKECVLVLLIFRFVSGSLAKSRTMLAEVEVDPESLEELILEAEQVKRKLSKEFSDIGNPLVVNTKKSAAAKAKAAPGKTARGRKKTVVEESDEMENEDEEVVPESPPPKKKRANSRSVKPVSKPSKTAAKAAAMDDDILDVDDDDDDEVIPSSRPTISRASRNTKASSSRGVSPAKKSAATSSGRSRALPFGNSVSNSDVGGKKRGAAARAKKVEDEGDWDDGSSEEVQPQRKKIARG